MTQQTADIATTPVLPSPAEKMALVTGDSAPSVPLRQQVEDAMAQLLGVSAQFRDLQPGQDRNVSTREETIAMMQNYLQRLHLTDAILSKLKVIHIAGTKGKGSTCAMVERILRDAGYKTGMFTSPHLISPCERFRINGKPISEAVFLRHFHAIWKGLEQTADQSGIYPPMAWFFRFLTLLALHLFVEEQVDVIILEVGIGGRLDATNVFMKPVACGVTTLDLDHTRILGETLDQIAYAKAGIFKKGVVAFTPASQDPAAMAMLEKCAAETVCPLVKVPSLDEFGPEGCDCKLGMQGAYQRVNAALAVALASTFLKHKRGQEDASFDIKTLLEPVVREGLKNAFWPARSHVMNDLGHHTRFYIDGAHTLRSLECCAEWFQAASAANKPMASKKVLIFTIHHERDVATLFAPLLNLQFDRVYFCPTSSTRPSLAKVHTFSEALAIANFQSILDNYTPEELATLDSIEDCAHGWQTTLERLWRALKTHLKQEDQSGRIVSVKNSIVECITEMRDSDAANKISETDNEEHWSVLVTGSLLLAGEALDFLEWRE